MAGFDVGYKVPGWVAGTRICTLEVFWIMGHFSTVIAVMLTHTVKKIYSLTSA